VRRPIGSDNARIILRSADTLFLLRRICCTEEQTSRTEKYRCAAGSKASAPSWLYSLGDHGGDWSTQQTYHIVTENVGYRFWPSDTSTNPKTRRWLSSKKQTAKACDLQTRFDKNPQRLGGIGVRIEFQRTRDLRERFRFLLSMVVANAYVVGRA
jgi:hypothetical protein